MRFLASLALSLILSLGAARADEYSVMRNLPLPAIAGCPAQALLTQPSGWREGDAVIATFGEARAATLDHDRLVAALLGRNAAVLEVGGDAACMPAALEALGAALRPGLLVAIGYGAAGAGALVGIAATPLLTAAVALTPTRIAFAGGAPAAAAERLDQRWPLFCGALATVAPIAGQACHGAIVAPRPIAVAQSRR